MTLTIRPQYNSPIHYEMLYAHYTDQNGLTPVYSDIPATLYDIPALRTTPFLMKKNRKCIMFRQKSWFRQRGFVL